MKKIAVVLFVAFFIFQGCGSSKKMSKPIDKIEIAFQQNGTWIKPINGVIKLKKTPFSFIFHLPKNVGVLVHASYNDSISKFALQNSVASVFDKTNVVAIDLFNKESTLYITDDSSNASYYANEEEHTFNEVTVLKTGYKGTQTITKMYDMDASKEIALKNINSPIYLSFAAEKFDEQEHNLPFLIGQNFQIEWID